MKNGRGTSCFSWQADNMFDRPLAHLRITAALKRSRVVLLLGPRQFVKTTLARALLPVGSKYVYLPKSLRFLDYFLKSRTIYKK